MKTGFVLITLLLGCCFQSKAQIVPGYQGKRNFINYQINIGPALLRPTYMNKISTLSRSDYPGGTAGSSVFIPFNTTHTLNMERVVGRKLAVAFTYSFAASKDYFSFEQQIANESTGELNTYSFPNKQLNIYGHYYQGSFTFYGKNALAPFGKYFKINIGYCNMMGKFTDKQLTSSTQSPYTGEKAILNTNGYYKTHSFGWGFSFGMNRIFKNRIVVNRGVSFFLPTKPEGFVKGASDLKLQYVTSTIARRLNARDLATFYLGCGYLF